MQVQRLQPEPGSGALSARPLASDAVTAFGSVTEELGGIRALHMEITAKLTEFSDLVGSQKSAGKLLIDLEDRVEAMGQALTSFSISLKSPDSSKRLTTTRSVLDKVSLQGRILAAIATLTRTTAASMGVQKIDQYLEELHQTAAQIKSGASHVTQSLNGLGQGYVRMTDSCDMAREAMSGLPPKLMEGREVLDHLTQDEARAAQELSNRATRLVESGKSNLKSFVTAMQFSDRLAQRLDHIAQMMDLDDPHITAIARAQARDCSNDIQDISQDVRRTMSDMGNLGREGAALFSEGEIAALIHAANTRRLELMEMVTSETKQVDDVLVAVHKDAALIEETTKVANQKFVELVESAERLSIASVNSLLLASQSGDAGAPLKTLASEVRDSASQCLSGVATCKSNLLQIFESRDQAHATLAEASQALTQAISTHDEISANGESRLAHINQLRDSALGSAETLLALVEAVHASMVSVDQVGSDLVAMSQEASSTEDQPLDIPLMTQVWDLYTMDEERNVHRTLYPDVPEQTPEPASDGGDGGDGGDGDDLDDIFF